MIVLRRLLHIALILPALSLVLFVLLHALPGSAEEMLLASNPQLRLEQIDRIRARQGFDKPIIARYGCWLVGRGERICRWWPGGQGVLRGDLGFSRIHGRPVADLLSERIPRTLGLMLPAMVTAFVCSLVLGSWAARARDRWPDRLISAVGLAGLALPLHWLAMLAVLVFSLELHWFPASGVDSSVAPGPMSKLRYAALPILVTTIFYTGRWLRYVRASVAEASSAPFVTAMRARGLPDSRIALHLLRNAMVPIFTVVGHSLPVLFSGAVVIERVFAYPGMGTLLLESVLTDDHLVAAVVLLAYALATLVSALVTDVLLWSLDPRERRPGTGLG